MQKTILLALATHNKGKLREYELLFRGSSIDLKGLSFFQKEVMYAEQGNSFEEIAIHKARYAARILGIPALADDSGLEVEALRGAPGIFSARYAGEPTNDRLNTCKLIEEMKDKVNRNAAFVCCLALSKPTGEYVVYTGKCNGIILSEPAGTYGFGYDPCFYYPPLAKTFAELTDGEKNKVSHRGQAMKRLKNDLSEVVLWLQEK